MTTCIVCDAETSNPKFCSRSCAAKHNNAKHPKRRPQGNCAGCGVATRSQQPLCAICAKARSDEKALLAKRASQNVRRWTTLNGQTVEAQIKEVSVTGTMRFEHHTESSAPRRLSVNAKASDLISVLVGICFDGAPYISQRAARRYIVLLNEMLDYSVPQYGTPDVSLRNVPVGELLYAMGSWVQSYFKPDVHPLMPSYALDCARLVQKHMEGHRSFGNEPWSFEQLVEEVRHQRDFVDAQYKKTFTEQMGPLLLTVEVPAGGQVISHQGESILAQGAEFVCHTKRCHLSAGVYDTVHALCNWPRPKFDLMDEFKFMCASWFERQDGRYVAADISRIVSLDPSNFSDFTTRLGFVGLPMEIPAEWITGVIVAPDNWRDPHSRPSVLKVPDWVAEV